MDHFDLWPGAHLAEHDVVLYCAKEDYLGVPFLDYIARYSKDLKSDITSNVTADELDSIVQTCFYYALLQEIFRQDYSQSDYIAIIHSDSETPRKVVTTKLLQRNLHKWVKSFHSESDECRRKIKEHFQACFDELKKLHLLLRTDVLYHTHQTRTCPDSLFAAIHHATYAATGRTLDTGFPSLRLPTKQDIQSMVDNGHWCPFEADRAWWSCSGPATRMMMRTMIRKKVDPRHDGCSTKQCQVAFVKADEFVCAHAGHDCTCDEFFHVDEEALLDLLKSKETPVLRLRASHASEHVCVELIAAAKSAGYVAISHVWSDGLGNPFANATRRCQLRMLAEKASNVARLAQGLGAESEDFDVCVWLDTLCVPIAPESAKLLAIKGMVDYYREARCVLVLDSEIRTHAYDLDHLMLAGIVVFSSRWMWRLWTLQEATLAKRLYFAFANGYVERSVFIEADLFDNPSLESAYGAANVVYELSRKARGLAYQSEGEEAAHHSHGLTGLYSAVRSRLLSMPSDEPICLANLCGIDIDLQNSSEGSRMAQFWREFGSQGAFDQRIIFHPFPRMQLVGARWSPVSLLEHRLNLSANHQHFNFTDISGSAKGTYSPEGIGVTFPGFKGRVHATFPSFEKVAFNTKDSFLNLLFFRHKATSDWYCFNAFELEERFRWPQDDQFCAILLDRWPAPDEWRSPESVVKALLVKTLTESDEQVHAIHVGVLIRLDEEDNAMISAMADGAWPSNPHEAKALHESAVQLWQSTTSRESDPGSFVETLRQHFRDGGFCDITNMYTESRYWIVG